MFIEKLRATTAHLHKALEEGPYSVKLLSDDVTMADYRIYLAKLYGFLLPFEDIVLPGLEKQFPQLGGLHKAPLIAQDLLALEFDVNKIPLMASADIGSLYPKPYSSLGGLYVLEGSTLGGMVIYKHLQKTIGSMEGKASYFTVYGAHTGSKWMQFLQQFSFIAEARGAEDEVIDGAVQTFKALKDWMK